MELGWLWIQMAQVSVLHEDCEPVQDHNEKTGKERRRCC